MELAENPLSAAELAEGRNETIACVLCNASHYLTERPEGRKWHTFDALLELIVDNDNAKQVCDVLMDMTEDIDRFPDDADVVAIRIIRKYRLEVATPTRD